ncbi:MAG TPA: hypothetical protein VML01_10135 [Bryobacterales bacterium]|nr:hypothetical protein [Bryobacterales bacterium]
MSTAAQQQANKQNAQYSTGPRTEEGKKRSSLNALKHGLRASAPLIPGENRDDFCRHGAELEVHLRPANAVEEDLVEQIIDITWRLKRCGRIESALINELFDSTAEQPENQDADRNRLLGKALVPDSRLAALNRLDRHEAHLGRRYHSAMKELLEARKRRRQAAFFNGLYAPKAKPAAESDAESAAAADPAPGTGAESEMTEQTQSIVTLLESIAPMKNPTAEPDPSTPGITEFYMRYPQSPGQTGNREAAK